MSIIWALRLRRRCLTGFASLPCFAPASRQLTQKLSAQGLNQPYRPHFGTVERSSLRDFAWGGGSILPKGRPYGTLRGARVATMLYGDVTTIYIRALRLKPPLPSYSYFSRQNSLYEISPPINIPVNTVNIKLK
jgi:hypothetical protein